MVPKIRTFNCDGSNAKVKVALRMIVLSKFKNRVENNLLESMSSAFETLYKQDISDNQLSPYAGNAQNFELQSLKNNHLHIFLLRIFLFYEMPN
ncbi:uncharacterized protein PHALS_15196 [Plasmopara halstedii]|uniref:Uncharacterized protein n=1 Tax=Plasmopara halstedii TaxID=4781 RepID=A0A0P1B471_PLAHL|nr:uncharacterized protein PHALS_15196 [Plasmopara halstedii]CEG49143.1 hypothetical protein PHALS_15196 [Plasmopara halstedii]|eukprot:XP_024585512.1 hypothetical protein PHALS_15196 [Plasmopara halstedii]